MTIQLNKKLSVAIIIALFFVASLFAIREIILRKIFEPTPTFIQGGAMLKVAGEAQTHGEDKSFEIIAENLKVPWEIAFLPDDGGMLATERIGVLKKISGADIKTYAIEGVEAVGEGGLLGMALHPNFKETFLLYLYLTTEIDGDYINEVERYKFESGKLSDKKIIISGIPGGSYHNGGRIAFGADGYLYIATGDAGDSDLAQDIKSLAGKILRVGDDGSIPPDNPFHNAVYSYGHRNPQGLAWDDKKRLWATEHGRSGIASGFDELNLIEKGKNYGWPVIQGDEKKAGMESPIAQSGSSETWAPAGAAFKDGSIFFGGLRGESLYEAKITGEKQVSLKAHFRKEFGRIRAVCFDKDGLLYFSTSNADARGAMKPNDDKIIRVNPKILGGGGQMSSSKKVVKLNELTPAEARVIVNKGTESPFNNEYDALFREGLYICRRCNAPLYESKSKFHSGCGWPSFDDEIKGAVKKQLDADGERVEIICANCGAHLGHVFVGEELTPKNTRHCVNAISMFFIPKSFIAGEENFAVFGGGCFWCIDATFKQLKGVNKVVSGYAGGQTLNPTYESVSEGTTGHAEVINVAYDPKIISYRDLLEVFFYIHDPTTLNCQGADFGEQYRSIILYATLDQKEESEKIIKELNESKAFEKPIVTEVSPLIKFYPAEEYHQNYFEKNKNASYCQVVISPKLNKLREKYRNLLK